MSGKWAGIRVFVGLGVCCLAGLVAGCSSSVGSDEEQSASVTTQALTAPAWQANKAYAVGTLASYQGKLYRVVQAHTSLIGWEPPNVPALWSFEGTDTGSNTPTGPSGPNGPLTLDYVTLQADCDARPETCCATGSTPLSLTTGNDTRTFSTSNQCTLALAGADTLTLTGSGKSALNLGSGDDTAFDGPGDDFIWGGLGNDTINGYNGTNLFFGGFGDDTIKAANGTNTVIPGPGRDTVSLGVGNDTVRIFDLCEVAGGETLDGGSGFDTLYSPVPLAELQAKGVTVANFERVIVQNDRCRSQCGDRSGCSYCGDDDDHDGTTNCADQCPLDPAKTKAGICGCSVSELDSDSDGAPNCVDECPTDAKHTFRGMCGCAGAPGVAPAGTFCTDGFAAGAAVCDGAGSCGNPLATAPETGCTPRTLDSHVYWFCPPRSLTDAAARCSASSGRSLVQIDSREENAYTAKFATTASWIGASDRGTEGEWFWRDLAGKDTKKFWTGGGAGKPFKGLYQSWLGGNPGTDDAKDCATISSDGSWSAESCNASHPYICEGAFGASRDPGNGLHHTPVGPVGIIPRWASSSNGGVNASTIPESQCIPLPTDPAAAKALQDKQEAEVKACGDSCGPGSQLSPEQCDALCSGEAKAPPAGSHCTPTGEPLSQLDKIVPNSCTVQNQNCAGTKIDGKATVCGTKVRCLDVTKDAKGVWSDKKCAKDADCPFNVCDPTLKKCINPSLLSACDGKTMDVATCKGECFSDVGCGTLPPPGARIIPEEDGRCAETRFCSPPYTAPLNDPNSFTPSSFDGSKLPDSSQAPPPPYFTDFETPCKLGCAFCTQEQIDKDPECGRAMRHTWCTYDPTNPPGTDQIANVNDGKKGDRGSDSSVIKFTVDPDASLDFNVRPLAFGVSKFDLTAAAAIRAEASFNLLFARGVVEVVDVRGQLEASLCRVSTKDSRLEILGVDFLPALTQSTGAIFDTDEKWAGAADCKKAVDSYVDTVDRAKKALRDAQELITQYNTLKASHRTFSTSFCTTVAGPGMRPTGMPGSCDTETPEQTINQFITYYENQVGQIDGALNNLTQKVLKTSTLTQLLGLPASNGFDFFAPIGTGLNGNETTTIITVQFFIGPVPCLLDVASYVNYGILGGFGANLTPSALISGGGKFAKASAVITPYADAGVTLFVGAGFSVPGLSVRVGIDGGVNLGSLELPATASAGLSLVPEPDTRALPSDLLAVTDGRLLYPRNGSGLLKYNLQFDYSYGVDLTVKDMLDGFVDGSIKVKFLFFSKKWSKRLFSFDSGLQIGPINLIGGGSVNPTTQQPAQRVAEDTKTWKSAYNSLVFAGLRRLDAPAPAELPLTANASFDASKVTQLFYDSQCRCDKGNDPCDRNVDCCDKSLVCFADPAHAGAKTCSACRKVDPTSESCNSNADCCGGGVCDQSKIKVNCHTEESCDSHGLCVGIEKCDEVTPPTKLCHPAPIDSPT